MGLILEARSPFFTFLQPVFWISTISSFSFMGADIVRIAWSNKLAARPVQMMI